MTIEPAKNGSLQKVSVMASTLVASEIIRLAGEINDRIALGDEITNLTIGDFDPALFPIPAELTAYIKEAYDQGHTNYPAANGVAPLREAVASFILERQGLRYEASDILIAGGARPLIYAAFQAIADPGDQVIYPVPSWNNNHYSHLARTSGIELLTTPVNRFMPSATDLPDDLSQAVLLALCSPLNPTGTVFSLDQLEGICDRVLDENRRREGKSKPLYILYDQIYCQLTYGNTVHYDPVSLRPELRPYTLYIDGISKAFAATGVRLGWAFGPAEVVSRMRSILGHIGAWSPKAEQMAAARYLRERSSVDTYLSHIRFELSQRLQALYRGFSELNREGFAVDVIAPEAAIYLTAMIDLRGKSWNGKTLDSMEEVTAFLLADAGIALVPFYAFGAPREFPWYRISVGTLRMDAIPPVFSRLRESMSKLK